jgi:signal transduction histidine kinase
LKSWAITIFLLLMIQSLYPVYAQHILQGQLLESSIVDFELVDGFAFQNSILVRLNGEPYGHFNGTVGMRAKKLQSLINQLNSAKEDGGKFYLPMGSKTQKGVPVVQSIVHFPSAQEEEGDLSLSKQCAPVVEEHQARINQVFKNLQQEISREEELSRSPASIID